jgi:hypothetical protein
MYIIFILFPRVNPPPEIEQNVEEKPEDTSINDSIPFPYQEISTSINDSIPFPYQESSLSPIINSSSVSEPGATPAYSPFARSTVSIGGTTSTFSSALQCLSSGAPFFHLTLLSYNKVWRKKKKKNFRLYILFFFFFKLFILFLVSASAYG